MKYVYFYRMDQGMKSHNLILIMEENILSESIIDVLVKETNQKNLLKAA